MEGQEEKPLQMIKTEGDWKIIYLTVYVGRKTLIVDSVENIEIQRNSFGLTTKTYFSQLGKTKTVAFIQEDTLRMKGVYNLTSI